MNFFQLFTKTDLTLPVEDKKKTKTKRLFSGKKSHNLGMLNVSKNKLSIWRKKDLRMALLLSKSLLEANVRGNSRHGLKIKTQPLSMSHVIDKESEAATLNLCVGLFKGLFSVWKVQWMKTGLICSFISINTSFKYSSVYMLSNISNLVIRSPDWFFLIRISRKQGYLPPILHRQICKDSVEFYTCILK